MGRKHRITSSPESVTAGQTFASSLSFQPPAREAAAPKEPWLKPCFFGGCKQSFRPHSVGRVLHSGCKAAAKTWELYQAAIKAGARDTFEAEVCAKAGIERKQ